MYNQLISITSTNNECITTKLVHDKKLYTSNLNNNDVNKKKDVDYM